MKKTRTRILFVLYVLLLVWVVLFKLRFPLNLGGMHRVREVNLIPFYHGNVPEGDDPWMGDLLNGLIFVPFGFLLRKSFHIKVGWCVLIGAGLSLAFELAQYIFSIDSTDITDLITNTLGGAAGVGLAYWTRKRE